LPDPIDPPDRTGAGDVPARYLARPARARAPRDARGSAAPRRRSEGDSGGLTSMPRLHQLLRTTREQGGSDLHLVAGLEPRIRKHGALEPLAGEPALSAEALSAILAEGVAEDAWNE